MYGLDIFPLWVVLIAELAIGWIALDGGYRIGRWRHRKTTEEKDAPVSAMVAAILGLVAFMLAFTFGLAASRFDAKRQTVLEEANAIGTTYLRTRLLPEPYKTATAKMLREYVDVRIRAVEGNAVAGIADSEKLQELLWQQAVAAAEKDHGSIMTGLFIQSLNDMIDVHAKRLLTGMRSRIPPSIWVALFALS